MQGLSAGRVQSVATRLVVERERERMAFVAAEYWDIVATLRAGRRSPRASPRSTAGASRRGATSRRTGRCAQADAVQLTEADARKLADGLDGAPFAVTSVEEKPYTRRPAAPFMTSTLQQEASRKLRLSSQQTMRVAQRLYENGYITYMRTDSTTLSESALAAARDQARELYGADSVPAAAAPVQPQGQERAGGARGDPPGRRPLPDAGRGAPRAVGRRVQRLRPDLEAHGRVADGGRARPDRLGADRGDGGRRAQYGVLDRGHRDHVPRLPARLRGRAATSRPSDAEEKVLPPLAEGEALTATALEPDGHSTSPPARFTEARLVKALEERGIGRPSTYAAIMGTILDRGYVRKQGQALVPEFLAFAVVKLLEKHFPQLVDYEFTARMEDDLDEIASGDEARTAWLQRFYFGDGRRHRPEGARREDARARSTRGRSTPSSCRAATSSCASASTARTSSAATDRQTLPPDIAPDELTAERAEELLAQGNQEHELGDRPGERAATIAVRAGRYGPYVTEVRRRRREAAHGVALQVDVARDGDARGGGAAPDAPADARGVRRGGGGRGERPLRPVREEGQGDALARRARSSCFTITLDEALAMLAEPQAARPPRRRAAAEGARRRPGQRQADRRQGGPVRPVRDRRRDERQPARRATRSRRSRPSGRPSCSSSAATAARRRSASGHPKKRS